MSMTDVCRLCLTKDNLVWIFDKRFESSESMKDVIHITTGVEIHIKDIISQKICKKCCQVTIKMFEFRRTSLKNDKHLREECSKHLKENSIKIPNTDVIIKSEIKRKQDEVKKESKPEKPMFKIHPTVRDLFRVHPQIKLPTVCLGSHITPFVSMPMDEVENYFKVRKLDFNLHTKLALKSGRKVATKKTSSLAKPNSLNSSNSSNSSTTKIVLSKSESKENVIDSIRTKMSVNNVVLKTSDTYVKDVNTASHSKIKDATMSKSIVKVCDNIDLTKSSKETPEERANRKRKYPETDDDSSKIHSHKKPNFIESLGLTPISNDLTTTSFTESPALSYVANTSVPLHICTICNSVQYSAKDLRRHQVKHLRCQFCKTKFRTLETKTKHIENTCVIKNTMNNLPDVKLKKIEYNVKVRRKYPEAFISFPPIKYTSKVEDKSSNIKNIEETNRKSAGALDNIKPDTTRKDVNRENHNALDKPKPDTTRKDPDPESGGTLDKTKPDITRKDTSRASDFKMIKPEIVHKPIDSEEIIEIISDDEEPPTTSAATVASVDSSITKTVTNQDNSKTENSVEAATSNPPIPQSSSTTPVSPIPNPTAPIPENIVYNTVSIVRPDIKIKNNNLLENIESIEPKLTDVKVLKELLKVQKPLQMFSERSAQTEIPSNESICVNKPNVTTELKNLKQQLYVYKIPVSIKNGSYNVTYKYQIDAKQSKQLCLWNDLTPIDVKVVILPDSALNIAVQVINEESNNQETSHGFSLPTNSVDNLSEVERSENEPQIVNENSGSTQANSNPLILPSTATYNFPGVQTSRPQVTTTTSRFVCINTNADNSAVNVAPTTSIIDMNPMLNTILHPQSTTTPVSVTQTETTTPQPVPTSTSTSAELPVPNISIPVGLIRVKDVWELS